MSKWSCPLSLAFHKSPENRFLTTDHYTYTYRDLEIQTQYLEQFLDDYEPGSAIATQVEGLFFNSALLMACIRKQMVFFPLNPKLPLDAKNRYLKKASASYLFSDPQFSQKETLETKTRTIHSNAPCSYLLTSGTSSEPKIAVHSYSNHHISAITSNKFLNFTESKTWLHVLPIYHVSGLSLIFRTILAHASLIKTSDKIELILEKESITHLSLVPTQLKRLIKLKSLKKIECILLGGAPLPRSLMNETQKKSLAVYPTYGSTEMSSQVATYNPSTQKISLLPQRELKILDNQEILLKGPTLFLGYLTKQGIHLPTNSEGWFKTGDLGSYENDHFTFKGRIDNLMISGGENIQPEEIEQILLEHPSILEAIIVPAPDSEYGQRPIALIKAKNSINPHALLDFLQNRLPKYKCPKIFKPLIYSTLKPNRKLLAQQFSNNT